MSDSSEVKRMIDSLLEAEHQDSVERPGSASTVYVSPLSNEMKPPEPAQDSASSDESERPELPTQFPVMDNLQQPTQTPGATSSEELPEVPTPEPPAASEQSATPLENGPPPAPPAPESAAPPEHSHEPPAPTVSPEELATDPTPVPETSPPEPGPAEPPAEIPLVGPVGERFPADPVANAPGHSDSEVTLPSQPPSKSTTSDWFEEDGESWNDQDWDSSAGDSDMELQVQDDFQFMADVAARGGLT